MSARTKLVRLQRMLRERAGCEVDLAGVAARRRHLRKRIRELDAAIAMEATDSVQPYFEAIEGKPKHAVIGRIGLGAA